MKRILELAMQLGDYGTPGQTNYLNDSTDSSLGDVNVVGGYNVLDIASLVNFILMGICESNNCSSGDLNGDGDYDILDVGRYHTGILYANR